jgi:hypothetical protein
MEDKTLSHAQSLRSFEAAEAERILFLFSGERPKNQNRQPLCGTVIIGTLSVGL